MVEFSLIFLGTANQVCVIKTREIFNFLPLINNSVTIGLSFLLLSIQQSYHQKQSIFFVFYLDCILQYSYKYHPYHLHIQ